MLTKTIIENVFLTVGELFWLFSSLSQLHHMVTKRDILGLSAPTTALNASANVAWATYFTTRHLWLPVATNLANLAVSTAILAYLLGNRKQFAKGILSIVIVGPLTSYLLITWPDLAGWIGMAYNAIASTPWLVRVVTKRKVTGISERALLFAGGAMTCIFIYAVLIHAAPLIIGCLQGMVYEIIILRYYYRYRHH